MVENNTRIIALVELDEIKDGEHEPNDYLIKGENIEVKAKRLGKPFNIKFIGVENAFSYLRKNLDEYLNDSLKNEKIPDDVNTIGVLIGAEDKVDGLTTHPTLYPSQFYLITEE